MENHFEFKGRGQDLFIIILKNILFTLLTLGLYFPFAKTQLRKYFWNHLEVHGEKFRYTGNGWEILKGYALVFVVYLLFSAFVVITDKYIPNANILVFVVVMVAIFYFLPIIIIGSRAYLLSRTNLRGISFAVDKKGAKEVRMLLLKALFLSPLTLGLYNIVFFLKLRSIFLNNSYYGDTKFQYKEETQKYFWMNFKGIILSYLTLGIYSAWLAKDNMQFHARNTYIQGHNFSLDITGKEILFIYLKSIFFIFISLGIATPWVTTYILTFYVKRLTYNGDFDYTLVKKSEIEKYGALSDGIGDSLDLDFGI